MTKLTRILSGALLSLALLFAVPVQAQSPSTLPNAHRAAYHITTAATTTVVSSDAYVSSITISTSAVGTSFVAKVQNKEGTPKILIPAGTAAVGNQTLNFNGSAGAVYVKGGIDIVTTGTPGVIDVFVTYYQP